MKLALIGATGNVGKRILDEALRRGHTVTAIARGPAKVQSLPGGTSFRTADAGHPEELAAVLKGHDVVISSVPFRSSDPAKLIDAVRRSGVKRYLVVGGAGSLEMEPGKLVVDSGHVPDFALDEARRGKVFLDTLRGAKDLDWTMLSPSALFTAGERTGKFRLGADRLLVGADGKSWVSYEDYAIALLDDVEKPKHIKSRFTVGY